MLTTMIIFVYKKMKEKKTDFFTKDLNDDNLKASARACFKQIK